MSPGEGLQIGSMRPSIAMLLVLLALAPAAYPCTTFCQLRDGEAIFGRNYDFEFGDAWLLVNQRGVNKRSVAGDLSWTSRYGSVTFNQYGKEFPMDGMNEAGLVVALMWLDGTEYPAPDLRPRLGVLEWIQYQLDNRASVAELVAAAESVRVQGGTPIHYLVADRTGAAATIEYLDGRLVVHQGASLPAAVLANSRYDVSVAYLGGFAGFGGSKPAPAGPGSLERFARAAILARQPSTAAPVDRAFEILGSVAQANTRWSVVYEATKGTVTWTTRTRQARRWVAMAGLDFACGGRTRGIDANAGVSGDVASRLVAYGSEENLTQLLVAYASTSFLQSVPRASIEATAAHAWSFDCSPGRRLRGARR